MYFFVGLFFRCAAYFVIQMGQFGFWKQWSWEPLMAESLMLLLIDSNDVCLTAELA